MRLSPRLAVPLLTAAALSCTAGTAHADRLAVLALGTPGGPQLTDAAAPVSIMQVDTAYSGLGSWIKLPASLTITGNTIDEGHLTAAPDGSLLVAGYDAPAGTPAVATTAAASVPREVARIAADGTVDTTTTLGGAFDGGRVTAASTDGSSVWVSGDGTRTGASIVSTTLGASGSTAIPNPLTVASGVAPIDGSLYAGPGFTRQPTYPVDTHLYRVGTGLPTSGQQPTTAVTTGNPNSEYTIPLQAWGLDLDGQPGIDTIYASGAAGLFKSRLVNGVWTAAGSTGFNGGAMTVSYSDGVVHVYTVNGGVVAEQDDTTPLGGFTYKNGTALVVAPPGVSFRGLAVLPSGAPDFPRISFGASGLANAIGDPTNASLPVKVTDSVQPSGPFALSGYATGQDGFPDDSMLAANAFTATPLGVNDFSLAFHPHGIGNELVWMTATTPDGRSVTNTTDFAASPATDASSRYLYGGSDASTGDDVGDGYSLVADDELNTIGLYKADTSSLPLKQWDFTAVSNQDLWLGGNKAKERDIEASARSGNRIYWVGSNGNGSGGKSAPERNALYATDVSGSGAATQLSYVGRYLGLQADIAAWDHNDLHGLGADHFGLTASIAKGVDPKASDGSGFSIEGIEFAAASSSTVYVGLRAPLEPATNRHLALVLPVTNFDQLVNGNPQTAVHAQFGAPILWDLGGLGIREIRRNATGTYLILAGSVDAAGQGALYVWDGVPADAPVRAFDLPEGSEGSNWEGFMAVPDTLSPAASLRLIGDRGDAFIYGPSSPDAKDQDAIFRSSRTDVVSLAGLPLNQQPGGASGDVPATLSLALGAPASFGTFTPGLAKDYTTSTTATVTSTAGDATLAAAPATLANGAFSLAQPLRVTPAKAAWTGPASNDVVTIGFTQSIGANEPLRTGAYSATVTFTLATTTP